MSEDRQDPDRSVSAPTPGGAVPLTPAPGIAGAVDGAFPLPSAERISKERISALSVKLSGRYEFGSEVGAGPESVVYRGIERSTSEAVAIKIVDLPEDATVAGALAAEARLASGVDHPLVGKILGFEFDAEDAYFISRYIDGEGLNTRVRRDGPLPIDAVRRLGQDLSEALNAIHQLYLLHRNVKSTNVILRPDGVAILTDLGVGRPTGAPGRLSLPSAPAYTPPEVFEGFADQRSDLFGIGACLYEALTGRPPPMGYVKTADGLGPDPREHRKDVPEDLAELIRECLAREPGKRPESAAALGTALGRPIAQEGDGAVKASGWRTFLLVLLMVGAVGGTLAILIWKYAKAFPEIFGRYFPQH